MAKKRKGEPDEKLGEAEEKRKLLNRWKARIEIAIAYQKKHGDTQSAGTGDSRWTTNIKAMAGDFGSKTEIGDDAIDVNITHSTMETFLSPLWIQDPYVTIRPTCAKAEGEDGLQYDNVRRAAITELELNYWMRELVVRQVMKKMILDAEATNHGYALVGYIKSTREIENAEGDSTEPLPTIKLKAPFVRRIGPRSLLVPPGKDEFEAHEWIAIKWCLPLQDVKDRWPATTAELKSDLAVYDTSKLSERSVELSEWMESADSKLVDVYEVFDKRKKRILHIVKGHDQELNGGDGTPWPYDTEGFTVVHLGSPVQVPDEYYATPPMTLTMPQQKELNAARTATMRRENRSKAVIFVNGEVAQDQIDKYANSPDGSVVKMDLGDKKFAEAFQAVDLLPPRVSAYQYGQLQQADFFLGTGLGAQARGSGDPNIDSATASANVEKWQIVRQTNRGDLVRTAYIQIARKLWMILKQFPNEERDRMISGSYGEPARQVRYTLAELHGEFSWSMDLGSMLADDPQTRYANALGRYNLLRADPLVKGEALIYDLFTASGVHDVEKYLVTLRTPDEEWARMLNGLPTEPNERDDHATHMASHEVRGAQAEAMLDQMAAQGLTLDPMFDKLRFALGLLVAHVNATAQMIQMQQGEPSGTAGKPIAENVLRGQMKASSGEETQAEMGGQPIRSKSGKSPSGIPMRR